MKTQALIDKLNEEFSEQLKINEAGAREEIFQRLKKEGKYTKVKVRFPDDDRYMTVIKGDVKRKPSGIYWEVVTRSDGDMIIAPIDNGERRYLVAEETSGTKVYLGTRPDVWRMKGNYLCQLYRDKEYQVSKFSDKDHNLYASMDYVALKVEFQS